MTIFGVLVFIAVTILIAGIVYMMARRELQSGLGRLVEGYGLIVLVTAWIFLLIGLIQGAF